MGERSSRRIEDLCVTDVAFRVICADDVPDHSTIARFRRENREAVAELFARVLELAAEAGLGRVGKVALDGTRIAANASYGANRRRSWLRQQVDEAMAEADRVDAEEDGLFGEDTNPSRVPEPWSDPAARAERIRAALARAEQAAAEAAQAEEAKVAARRARVQESEERVAQRRDAAMARWEEYRRRRTDEVARQPVCDR